jgi:hypothetical protein
VSAIFALCAAFSNAVRGNAARCKHKRPGGQGERPAPSRVSRPQFTVATWLGDRAAAAAIVWALVATFIKTTTETLTESGVAAVFTDWPAYALAAGGAAGIILVQAALHVGPLSVSQPLLVIVDPSVSVILSIWLFQEHYTRGPAAIAGSLVAFTIMSVGVVMLRRTAPPTMQARPST